MTTDAGLQVVRFELGGSRFAIPAACVVAMRQAAGATGPGIGELLGLPGDRDDAPHLLVLRAGRGEVAVRFPGAVTLDTLSAAAIHPLPVLVEARAGVGGLAALAVDAVGVVMVIDPRRLGAPPT